MAVRRLQRTILINKRSFDLQSRKMMISFSSESPINGPYGKEILYHNPGCADLQRINNIGVLLFNGDPDKVIGSVRNAYIDNSQRKGYAEITFDDDEESEVIYQKVLNGTLRSVTLMFQEILYEAVEKGKFSRHGNFQGPVDVILKWIPYAISISSVPKDVTIGVLRQREIQGSNGNGSGKNRRRK